MPPTTNANVQARPRRRVRAREELPEQSLSNNSELAVEVENERSVEDARHVQSPVQGLGNRATEALLARLRANRERALALDQAAMEARNDRDEVGARPDGGADQDPELAGDLSDTSPQAEPGVVETDPSPTDLEAGDQVDRPPSEAGRDPESIAPAQQEADTAISDEVGEPGSAPQAGAADSPQSIAAAADAEAVEEAGSAPPEGGEAAQADPTASPPSIDAPTPDGGGDASADAGGAITLEPGPEVAAWRAQVTSDAQAIETPELPTAGGRSANVRRRGSEQREARGERREAITTEADAAVSPPPETEEAQPDPPPDPVPAANQLVIDTEGRTLSAATLPDLIPSPRGTQPTVPGAQNPANAVSRSEGEPEETTPENSSETATDAPSEHAQGQLDEIENTAEAGPPEPEPGTAEGATITQTEEPPRQPLPEILGNAMREVIARLLVDPASQAEPIITEARSEAYPNGVLNEAYPDIGNDRLPGLTDALSTALRAIAADAGIAADDLDAAVENRRQQVETATQEATDDICTAGREEAESSEQDSAEEVAEVEAAEDAQNQQTIAIATAAQGEANPEVIQRRAADQRRRVNRQAGNIKANYTRAKDRFHSALDRAQLLQNRAYDQTATADRAAIGEESSTVNTLQQGRVTLWLNNSKRALGTEVTRLKNAATSECDGFRGETTAAALNASQMIRDWENAQTAEEQGFWEQLWALFSDWSEQAEGEAEVWAEVRASEARDATVGNMLVLNQFTQGEIDAANLESNEAFQRLSEEQKVVVRTYYSSDPNNRDTIGAVAAGLRHRLSAEQKAPLIEALKSEVIGKPYTEWPQFEQIGRAERSGFSAETITTELYDAMFGGVTGWGTDEDKIYSNLSGLTPMQGRAVRGNYRADYGRSLDSDLASELDADNALIRARAALDGDPVMETVGALNEAMSGLGTDEDTIMRMLRGKTAEQRARIVEEYRRQYGVDLEAELDSEMDDHDEDRAMALLEGDTARADAIALDQAMNGGILGWGTDTDQIEGVYADIRNDVAGEQIRDPQTGEMRRMTQAEMEAEVLRRNQEVEASYDERYGDPNDQESALRAAFNDEVELHGPHLDLVNALADNDLVAADAARLERERQGFYTDDDVVNGILENQYARALDAVERDPATEARRRAIRDRAQREGWDSYRLADAERELQRELEQEARVGASANMAALEQRYDSQYSRWGSGGLQVMIAFNMSGTDQEKARTLLDQGGYLSPAQRIDYATRGPGTDEAEFERAIAGRTAAEIAEIDAELARMGRGSAAEIARDELDGRDYQDMSVRLRGVPQDPEEEMRQAEMRVQFEIANSPVTGVQRDVMEARLQRMRNQYALINDPDADPQERRRALMQFQARGSGVEAGVSGYRAQVDAVTDAVATAAALTAAIVVTVATGGVAGAVLGALAAAAMTMAVKAGMKGAAYGADEMAIDAIVGIVDAAAAYATFGMANALMRVASTGIGRASRLGGTHLASNLSRMAMSSSRTQRMLAHGVAEMVEGAAGALPSALAGNMLNDKNWEQGNPFMNIVGGTIMETGMGGIMGGAMGSMGGISMPKVDPPTPRTGDILAHRGTPADRLAAWNAHKAEFPDADQRSFLRQYDQQVRDRLAAESRDANIQRQLRGELLSGIPPRQRGQFADVLIEVMSDADFKAFTRSDSANAVTIIDGGEPRIIMRDGAPAGALREEGIHLQQIADPDLGRLARRLDEGRLADWDSMPLGEQLELYSIKVELEIDAQNKLIAGLRDDIAAATDPADIARMQRQLDLAETNLRNLTRRADEIGGLSPLDRFAMARGLRDPPDFLDKPPRLFQLEGDDVADSVTDAAADATSATRTVVTDTRPKGFDATTDHVEQIGDIDFKPRAVELDTKARISFTDADGVDVELYMLNGHLMDASTGKRVPVPTTFRPGSGSDVPEFTLTARNKVEVQRPTRDIEVRRTEGGTTRTVIARNETRPVSKSDLSMGGWRARKQTGPAGEAGELASLMVSAKKLEDGDILAVVNAQRDSGTGFDSVEIVRIDGRVTIRLVEVKNYGDGNYVSFEDFTAILFGTSQTTGNLANNLDELQRRLLPPVGAIDEIRDRIARDLPEPTPQQLSDPAFLDMRAQQITDAANSEIQQRMADSLGLSVAVYQEVLEAMSDLRIQPLIRRAKGTKIGIKGSDSASNRLLRHWGRMRNYLKYLMPPGLTPQIVVPKKFSDLVDADIPDDLLEIAEAAVSGLEQLRKGDGPLSGSRGLFPTTADGARFVTDDNKFLDVEQIAAGDVADDAIDDLADRLARRLREPVTTASGSHEDLHLVVDLSDLSMDKAQLEQRLREMLAEQLGEGAGDIIERVRFLRTRR